MPVLLASIIAARRRGTDTNTAVATGVQTDRTQITVAALLIVVVFIGFSAGDVLIIKQLGLGLAIAVPRTSAGDSGSRRPAPAP
jgi:RND superfamily putative drug exporter